MHRSLPRRAARWLSFLAALTVALVFAAPAQAQVHWDASAQVGGTQRFLYNRPQGGPNAGLGPAFEVDGHVALLPLLRVGAYVSGDITSAGPATRQMLGGGARVLAFSPWRSPSFHAWLFAGFGYRVVLAPSYHTTLPLAPDNLTAPSPTDVLVSQAGGGFFEIPVGIGGSFALRPPFQLVAELGTRFGLGSSGSVYEDPGRSAQPQGYPEIRLLPAGNDAFSLFLTLGIAVGR
jgi:hypothetical protein